METSERETHTDTHTQTDTQTHTDTYTHTHRHTQTHTNTHTHTHNTHRERPTAWKIPHEAEFVILILQKPKTVTHP